MKKIASHWGEKKKRKKEELTNYDAGITRRIFNTTSYDYGCEGLYSERSNMKIFYHDAREKQEHCNAMKQTVNYNYNGEQSRVH